MEIYLIKIEEALKLKELGFDEYCYSIHNYGYLIPRITTLSKPKFKNSKIHVGDTNTCTAPTYQQSFKWFRDKYKIAHTIKWLDKIYGYYFLITDMVNNTDTNNSIGYSSYEQAEEYCLKKIIDIVKIT